MDSQKSKQSHDTPQEESRFDNSSTLVIHNERSWPYKILKLSLLFVMLVSVQAALNHGLQKNAVETGIGP
jgi:hypothetical protein